MAYPTDSGVSYTTKVNNVDIINDSDVNNLQTEVSSIKTLLGTVGSIVTGTFYYLMSEITGSDKAVGKTATQTLTNKTLTSPVINVGSDATGDIYYRNAGVLTRLPIGTDNHILKVNGTTPNWEAEATVSAATTSAQGIGILADAAQITAGTASESGYPLLVTPDALAASTPVFNGSGLTGITKLLNTVTTDVTFSSSTAENTLLSYSVPGGTLGTSNVIRVTIHVSAFGVTNTNNCTLRFKYGATTISSKTYTPTGANASLVGKIEFILAGAGSTSSQNGSHFISMGQTNYVGNGNTQIMMFTETAQGTATEDSTASKTLAITSQHSNSNASDNITASIIVTEILR